MDKSTFIALLALIFIGGGIYNYSHNRQVIGPKDTAVIEQAIQAPEVVSDVTTSTVSSTDASSTVATEVVLPHIVTYTNAGFSSSSLTIKKGETVTFENKSTRKMWVASSKHPTHRDYPGSDIKKCGTESASTIFDACKGFAPGESWSFTFNEVGTWKYHDHLSPKNFGSITVE
ncbi:MAG: hypothetical protein HZA35_01440 [Parcubacteria group bacterium]|nr:hypothetical protein [Parcubacteria group bacterium]